MELVLFEEVLDFASVEFRFQATPKNNHGASPHRGGFEFREPRKFMGLDGPPDRRRQQSAKM